MSWVEEEEMSWEDQTNLQQILVLVFFLLQTIFFHFHLLPINNLFSNQPSNQFNNSISLSFLSFQSISARFFCFFFNSRNFFHFNFVSYQLSLIQSISSHTMFHHSVQRELCQFSRKPASSLFHSKIPTTLQHPHTQKMARFTNDRNSQPLRHFLSWLSSHPPSIANERCIQPSNEQDVKLLQRSEEKNGFWFDFAQFIDQKNSNHRFCQLETIKISILTLFITKRNHSGSCCRKPFVRSFIF